MEDSPEPPGQEPAPAPLQIPRGPRGEEPSASLVRARHELAERAAGGALPHLGGLPVPPEAARGNIENMVGWAQVPVGLAGPLLLDGTHGRRDVLVPLATTEGALVASTSRGMGLVRVAGGVRARVTRDELSQHPVLVYEDMEGALVAAEAARGSLERFQGLVSTITTHGRLVRVEPEVLGRRLVLRLVFTTGDAIGINMAAHGAELCCADLAVRTGAVERHVHGQDVEKRANARALIEGRGRSVVAEATVPRQVLAERARTSPEAMVRVMRTYAAGFAQLGTQNWTIQSANTLAALFLACGQDVAYVTECATGLLDLDLTGEGDLHATLTLPSLLLGSVGGGSGQGTAQEALQIMGCAGSGKAVTLAEIAAGTVLAGDLSLLAAFASHEFVAAHESLGRNRPRP
jgi:hydroxymethylglutaryl-CoA reductase (NADPH)